MQSNNEKISDPKDIAVIGDRHAINGDRFTIKFIGELSGRDDGIWLGIEWDRPGRGSHVGYYEGRQYFTCPQGCGSFIRHDRKFDEERTVLCALGVKYGFAPNDDGEPKNTLFDPRIDVKRMPFTSKKDVEFIGLEKIIHLQRSRVIILDYLNIAYPTNLAGLNIDCRTLSLCGNLFSQIRQIDTICANLYSLRELVLDDNRFSSFESNYLYENVESLSLSRTELTNEQLKQLLSHFPALSKLSMRLCGLIVIDYSLASVMANLRTLDLRENKFRSLADLKGLINSKCLENLYLSGNEISRLELKKDDFPNLKLVDLSENQISDWHIVDSLNQLDSLERLRLQLNPVCYDDTEESVMMELIARIPRLQEANGTTITDNLRHDAELFFLSKTVERSSFRSDQLLQTNSRVVELCSKYERHIDDFRQAKNFSIQNVILPLQITYEDHKRLITISRRTSVSQLKLLAKGIFGIAQRSSKIFWESPSGQIELTRLSETIEGYQIEPNDRLVVRRRT